MIKNVIFDLDLTLVDSSAVAHLRDERRWREIYPVVGTLTMYDGIRAVVDELLCRKVKIAIVTSSPRPYCEAIVKHHSISSNTLVCYHDTALRKPHPDPLLRALANMGGEAAETIAVGDQPHDMIAAKRAGMIAAAAMWGCADRKQLLNTRPDVIFETVGSMRSYLLDDFSGDNTDTK